MHLSDEQLAAMAASDGAETRKSGTHVASCPLCTERLEAMRRDYRAVDALLQQLDHRPPVVDVRRVIEVARRRRWAVSRPIAAGIALCAVAAAAAAAIPNTPVHRALVRALAFARVTPTPAAPIVPDRPGTRAGTGIAIVPGAQLDVHFRTWQTRGDVSITFGDGAQLALVPRGGDAAFSVSRGRVDVDNRGSDASYTIEVPRTVQRVRVYLDTVLLFEKAAEVVNSRARPDSTGRYTLELSKRAAARSARP